MRENRFAVFSDCGRPGEVLSVVTAPVREPVEGELCVRMLAAPVNPCDILFIRGAYGEKPVLPHSRAGLEGCGVVVESRAEGFVAGDQVLLLYGAGAWGRFLTAPAERFLLLPQRLDPVQAAMLKINPLTAYLLLHPDDVPLQRGDWVAQNAAHSGVGRCFIQLAHQMGLRTVNFVRRARERREELMALGADLVLDEEDGQALPKALEAIRYQRPVLAANAVGGASACRLMDLLRAEGTLVTYGAMGGRELSLPANWLIFKNIRLRGLWYFHWLVTHSPSEHRAVYAYLASLVATGRLQQPVDSVFQIDNVQEAILRARGAARRGKVILRLGE